MFYQVDFSPVSKQKQQKVIEEKPEVIMVSLAPFTHNPKLLFEDVRPRTTVTRRLQIKNPSKNNVELVITKGPPEERDVTYTWVEELIPAESSSMLEITWSPTEIGSWRDVLTLEDGNRIKKDIPVVFKCVSPKKSTQARNKLKPISAKIKPISKKIKKPSPTKKISPKKTPKWKTSPGKRLTSPKVLKQSIKEKRPPLQSNNSLPELDNPMIRRQTFLVTEKENCLPISDVQITIESPTFNSHSFNECFDDSLEINSPKKTPLHSTVNLAGNTFCLSSSKLDNPLLTQILSTFMPSMSSTGEKSKHSSINENTTYDYIGPNENLANISGGTYVKANLSGSTYVKANISAGTYILDDSIGNLGSLSDYPGSYQENMLPKTIPCNQFQEYQLPKSSHLFGANMYNDNVFSKPFSLFTSNADETRNIEKKTVLEEIMEESFQPSSGSEQDPPKRPNPPRKRKSDMLLKLSPPKKQLSSSFTQQNIVPVKRTKVRSGLNLREFIAKSKKVQEDAKNEKCEILHNPDMYLTNTYNPYVLASTNEVDPFISATLYYEPRWLEHQELRFKKWMNILLTPPEGLMSNADSHPVDVARLWQNCKKREVDKALTKEEMSSKVTVRGSLDKLRCSAINLFRTPKVCHVLSKVTMLVENTKLSIRKDKNVHVDLSLQSEIMTLFLCYNPLWLRIGLETIFGRTLKLNSNSDLMGLSSFILQNFFKDSYLLSKYKTIQADRYTLEIKKHILKKFLMLIYFLDCAKEMRLIPYDPCLFCKNAPYKESRELLLKFSSTLLSAVGDITKCLKLAGFVLTHKQTYIHEFDYSVTNLGQDLRDGVRLTKVMEIILLKDNLLPFLRTPAISRLQKIHNVKIAFDALQGADYCIQQDITPKDIVDGHREKTMSLLWQIIYKFQAPLFKRAVVTVQNWWRCFPMIIKRRILKCKRKHLDDAATIIQQRYRASKEMQYQREAYLNLKNAAVIIQTRFRLKSEMWKERRSFICKRQAAIIIQRRYTATIAMRAQRNSFNLLKRATIVIQNYYHAYYQMKVQRNEFLMKRNAVIKIQVFIRSIIIRNYVRNSFIALKQSVICLQRIYRANKMMHLCKNKYDAMKQAAIVIQRRFKAKLLMRKVRDEYLQVVNSTIVLQINIRAYLKMHKQRFTYLKQKNAAITIQRRFCATKLMREQRTRFLQYREAIIQMQRLYRAKLLMKNQRQSYLLLKKSVLLVENKYLAKKLMQKQRKEYQEFIQATITIQRKFRATMQMKLNRFTYLTLKKATITIQRMHRANTIMQIERAAYLKKKDAAVIIQTRYRAYKEMQLERQNYQHYKKTVIRIQVLYRANMLMKKERFNYLHLKKTVLYVEQKYMAMKSMMIVRRNYIQIIQSIIIIQRRYRATRLMHTHRMDYLTLRESVVVVQCRYRANKQMQEDRQYYLDLKKATITIQRRYRANIQRNIVRKAYVDFKNSVILLQRKFRANQAMHSCRSEYLKKLRAIVLIQVKFKAHLLMISMKNSYKLLIKSAVRIQQRYRAVKMARLERQRFVAKRNAVVKIQMWYRGICLMRQHSVEFKRLRVAIVIIQRYFRGYIEVKKQVRILKINLETVVKIQTYGRGFLSRRRSEELKKPEVVAKRKMMLKRTVSATKIQASWRGFMARKSEPKQMAEIRERYCMAAKNTNSKKTIGHRKDEALKVLISENSTYLQIIRALEDIEYVTRRCKDTCLNMSNKLSSDIGDLIKSTGRSLPDMNACMVGTNILINFCKYPPSSQNAWLPQHIDGIILVMSHWCDKESLLFPLLCTLIWLYTHNRNHLKYLKNIPNIKQQMIKMKTLCERKQKMMSNGNHKNAAIFTASKNLPLPSLTPDWGLEFKSRPRAFTNSVHALKCLLSALSIE